jgi:glycosyltransferase involved in cell wall biosynthesis
MFLYFTGELAKTGADFAVAAVPGSKVMASLAKGIRTIGVSDNGNLSLPKLLRQVQALRRIRQSFPYDVIHAWSSRDWDLGAILGTLTRRPVLGTLHDHPRSGYISPKRRLLMRWTARCGLDRLVCVSNAVQQACRAADYPDEKIVVVRNGVPECNCAPKSDLENRVRLGYLGVLSEPKGIGIAFEILDQTSRLCDTEWEFHVAGGTQQEGAELFVRHLRSKYGAASWWPRVRWHGWIDRPIGFIHSLDLLIFPSIMFDSFPNVLLEAGLTGTPVLASNVGGVAEIVQDRQTGWLFDTARVGEAAKLLAELVGHPDRLRLAGRKAKELITARFTMRAMISEYQRLYGELTGAQ